MSNESNIVELSKNIIQGECGGAGYKTECSITTDLKTSDIENVTTASRSGLLQIFLSDAPGTISVNGDKYNTTTYISISLGGCYTLNNQVIGTTLTFMIMFERSKAIEITVPIIPSSNSSIGTNQIVNLIAEATKKGVKDGENINLGLQIDMNSIIPSKQPFYYIKSKKNKGLSRLIFDLSGAITLPTKEWFLLVDLIANNNGVGATYNNNTDEFLKVLSFEYNNNNKSTLTKVIQPSDVGDIYYNPNGINSEAVITEEGETKGSRQVSRRGGVNTKGNNYNINNTSGDIYIDCQPVNTDEEEMNVKMEGYRLQTNFDLFNKDKIKKFFLNPWVQGFLLFIVILILFYVVKMLMAKGKTQGKADLNIKGS